MCARTHRHSQKRHIINTTNCDTKALAFFLESALSSTMSQLLFLSKLLNTWDLSPYSVPTKGQYILLLFTYGSNCTPCKTVRLDSKLCSYNFDMHFSIHNCHIDKHDCLVLVRILKTSSQSYCLLTSCVHSIAKLAVFFPFLYMEKGTESPLASCVPHSRPQDCSNAVIHFFQLSTTIKNILKKTCWLNSPLASLIVICKPSCNCLFHEIHYFKC